MRFLRSIYFWLVLGSVVVVIGGDALYRDYSPNSKETIQAAEERRAEGESSTLLDPYLAGFFTAVILGGGWYAILRRR
jgi:hypothetical protein